MLVRSVVIGFFFLFCRTLGQSSFQQIVGTIERIDNRILATPIRSTLTLSAGKAALNELNIVLFVISSTRDGDGSKTTFDDLLESLKQFEDEPTDLLQAEGNTEGNFGGWGKNNRGWSSW